MARRNSLRHQKEWIVTNVVNDLKGFDAYKVLLGGPMFRNVAISALKGAATEIKKETLKNLRGVFPNAWKSNPNYKDSLYKGVLVVRTKIKGEKTETGVHILGTNEKKSQTYKLRFYEGEVTRSKGRSKASVIGGYWFFRKAVNSIDVWGAVKARLDKYLEENDWVTSI